jgi:hypothetical protein
MGLRIGNKKIKKTKRERKEYALISSDDSADDEHRKSTK